ncbi:MAG: ATP-grasp domain-containing protein, partial [Aeromonas sp.]
MAIAIRAHNNRSESLLNWRQLLNERTGERTGVIIRPQGSRFRLRPTDWVLNWGSSAALPNNLATVTEQRLINSPAAVSLSTNKIRCLETLQAAGVPTVEFTTDRQTAQGWFVDGQIVYARTVLQGHSGEGIVVCARDTVGAENSLIQAPLYTKGITGPRREFRVHVFGGVITNVQLKRRRNGYQEMANYSETIRNFHTGWVYAASSVFPNPASLQAALNAVSALGLTFGAVDVITNQENAWVLEVNTAPGMEGSNATAFVEALMAYTSGRTIHPWSNINVTATPSPTATAEATDSNADAAPVQEAPAPVEPTPAPRTRNDGFDLTVAANTVVGFEWQETQPVAPIQTNPFTPRPNGLENGGIYEVTFEGVNHIMRYSDRPRGFQMFGFVTVIPVNRV